MHSCRSLLLQPGAVPPQAPTCAPPPPPQAEYALRTAAIKAEPLEIVYSYYNGTGHRRVVTVGGTAPRRLSEVAAGLVSTGLRLAVGCCSKRAACQPARSRRSPAKVRPLPAALLQVRKGDTIGQFLKAVVEQLTPQFREIRWGLGAAARRMDAQA